MHVRYTIINKIKNIRTATNNNRFIIETLPNKKTNFIYTRVSSKKELEIYRDIYIKALYKLEQTLNHRSNKYNTLLHIDKSYSSLTCSNCKNVKNKKDLYGNFIYDLPIL